MKTGDRMATVYYVKSDWFGKVVKFVCVDFPGPMTNELKIALWESVFMYAFLKPADGSLGYACWHAVADEETNSLALELAATHNGNL